MIPLHPYTLNVVSASSQNRTTSTLLCQLLYASFFCCLCLLSNTSKDNREDDDATEGGKTAVNLRGEKRAELENVTRSEAVSGMKKANVSNKRRMSGDTWSKSRSERLLRQRQKHTPTQTPATQSGCALLTQIHTAVRGRRRSFTKHPTPPPPHSLPWVSLTPFLPRAHTPSSHTHARLHKVAGRQRAVHVACGESLLSSAN